MSCHVGDNIVAFDDQQMETVPQLMTLYRNLTIGHTVDVDWICQGYPMRLEMKVEDWPQ